MTLDDPSSHNHRAASRTAATSGSTALVTSSGETPRMFQGVYPELYGERAANCSALWVEAELPRAPTSFPSGASLAALRRSHPPALRFPSFSLSASFLPSSLSATRRAFRRLPTLVPSPCCAPPLELRSRSSAFWVLQPSRPELVEDCADIFGTKVSLMSLLADRRRTETWPRSSRRYRRTSLPARRWLRSQSVGRTFSLRSRVSRPSSTRRPVRSRLSAAR